MQTKIEIPGDGLKALVDLYEWSTEDDIELFEEEFPEYKGWNAELIEDSAKFDHEKGASYDYEIIITLPDGTKYKGEAGYRNMNGWYFETTTFYLYTPKEENILETITLYHNGRDNGDGSATIYWYLTEEESWEWVDSEEGYECPGSITSFVGSPEHLEALESQKRIKAKQ